MKQLIDKITNEDRLIKLYGCSECGSTGLTCNYEHREGSKFCLKCKKCIKCNKLGYTINRDSQVLDIVGELIRARECLNAGFSSTVDPKMKFTGLLLAEDHLSKALIKLIELAGEGNISYMDEEAIKDFFEESTIDGSIRWLFIYISADAFNTAFNVLLYFCNHHKIKIWDSVKEMLEGEG